MSGANGNTTFSDALRVDRRGDVAIVFFDVPGEAQNTLKAGFEEVLQRVMGELEAASEVRAIVFASGKKDGFIAGADVKMISGVGSATEAERLSRRGAAAMDRLATSSKPLVAAIHGACLGGGLELALACTSRVASDHPKTKLGLPEVQLGLLPGAGGTQRLPALIGLSDALDMMLTGKQVPSRKAKKLGLVDEVVPPSILLDVAVARARMLASDEGKKQRERKRRDSGFEERLREIALAENPVGRKIVFGEARKKLLAKTHGLYPAPERILEVVRVGLEKGMRAGLDAEARAFGELAVSPVAAELMNLFFVTTAMKKDRGVDGDVTPRRVHKVGVLGAGLMGAGVAYVSANAGIAVRIKDKDDAGVLRGLASVREILDERVARKRLGRFDADRMMSIVTGTSDGSGFHDVDVVIEAVFEDLELKRRVLRDVESQGKADVIFASNTSSLPIAAIAEASTHPETVVGMHYFSPVHKMPLLEVIVTDKTADWVTATAVELGKKQGKTVIVVRDGAGFYTTRVLAPFLNEAAHLLAEGNSIESIDAALVNFGFPVGPLKLTDEVGIDVGAKVGKILFEAFGERMKPVPGTEKLVADGRLGRKNGKGFYRYDGEKGVDETVYGVLGITPRDTGTSPNDLAMRCTLTFVNEAVRCLEEGILRSARDGDIGAIFGLGFPPFRGGPFRFVDTLGAREVVRRLEQLRERHGARFEPAALLREHAMSGARFYG